MLPCSAYCAVCHFTRNWCLDLPRACFRSVLLMQDSLPPEVREQIPVYSPEPSDAHLTPWDAEAYTRSASGMHLAEEEAEEAVVSTPGQPGQPVNVGRTSI